MSGRRRLASTVGSGPFTPGASAAGALSTNAFPGLVTACHLEHPAPAVDARKRSTRPLSDDGHRKSVDQLVLPLLPRAAGRVVVVPASDPRTLRQTHARPRRRGDLSPLVGPPDSTERRLWLGTRLLHEFRQPVPNQIAQLVAFQDRGWTERRVTGPLPREPHETDTEYQDRLHETIKGLNKSMPPSTIHFRGDGTGHGAWWDYARSFRTPEEPLGDGSAETRH